MTTTTPLAVRIAEPWEGTLVVAPVSPADAPGEVARWHGAIADLIRYATASGACALVTFPHDARKLSLSWSRDETVELPVGGGSVWLTPIESAGPRLADEIVAGWEFASGLMWVVTSACPAPRVADAVAAIGVSDDLRERPETDVPVILPQNDVAEVWWLNARRRPEVVARELVESSVVRWEA
jgi:hypothetical protein